MVLEVDSDAAYLVIPKAQSRFAGYFWLLDDRQKVNRSVHNGAILINVKQLKMWLPRLRKPKQRECLTM